MVQLIFTKTKGFMFKGLYKKYTFFKRLMSTNDINHKKPSMWEILRLVWNLERKRSILVRTLSDRQYVAEKYFNSANTSILSGINCDYTGISNVQYINYDEKYNLHRWIYYRVFNPNTNQNECLKEASIWISKDKAI